MKENDVVCDLWCGPGTNSSKFINAKAQYYLGLDPFDKCLQAAKKVWDERERNGSYWVLQASFESNNMPGSEQEIWKQIFGISIP